MSELRITPLGTVSPYAKGNKNCPGFLVEYNDNKYLFDCGNGITNLMNFPNDLSNLKIYITHLHPDHYGDLTSIIQASLVYKRLGYLDSTPDIYIPIDSYDFQGYEISREIQDTSLEFKYLFSFIKKYPVDINPYSQITHKQDDLTITSFPTLHQMPAYGFKIETPDFKICYSGDTGYFHKLKDFVKDSDLFICESTFIKGQNKLLNTHLYAYEAAKIAKDANVGKLVLTHFWPELDKNLYLNEAREIFESVEVAEEGKKLILRRD